VFFRRICEEVGSLREGSPCLFDALEEGFSFREGGVDLQGLLDGFDGRFLFFFRRVGPGEVVKDAFVIGDKPLYVPWICTRLGPPQAESMKILNPGNAMIYSL
jgi:hypothetical protein